jgi:hypothetical protein
MSDKLKAERRRDFGNKAENNNLNPMFPQVIATRRSLGHLGRLTNSGKRLSAAGTREN